MNRFYIKKEDYFGNETAVLNFVEKLGSMSDVIHLVIDGLTPEEMVDVKDNESFIKIKKIKLYNKAVVLSDDSKYDTLSYVKGLSDDITKQEFIDIFYMMRMEGYRGTKLLLNTLYNIEVIDSEEIRILTNEEIVADNKVGIFNDFNMYEDRFISVNGLCKKCRNPLCDMTDEAKIIPFMVNHKSCVKYKNLLEKVSKEVSEVRREEFVYLLEVLCDMKDTSDFTANRVLEHLMKIEKNNK